MADLDAPSPIVFRVVGPEDEAVLLDLLAALDASYFRPHPFTTQEAHRIATRTGRDCYAILVSEGRAVAYGLLRGWDEGYTTPSLGVAVRMGMEGQGLGRLMMESLHAYARAHGTARVRLRVHENNVRARRLYESLGYRYDGEDRGELVMVLDPIAQSRGAPQMTVL